MCWKFTLSPPSAFIDMKLASVEPGVIVFAIFFEVVGFNSEITREARVTASLVVNFASRLPLMMVAVVVTSDSRFAKLITLFELLDK